MNDTERLDFLDKMFSSEEGDEWLHFKARPDGIEMFTVVSQHQRASTIRELIDLLAAYESGERCWMLENYGLKYCHMLGHEHNQVTSNFSIQERR